LAVDTKLRQGMSDPICVCVQFPKRYPSSTIIDSYISRESPNDLLELSVNNHLIHRNLLPYAGRAMNSFNSPQAVTWLIDPIAHEMSASHDPKNLPLLIAFSNSAIINVYYAYHCQQWTLQPLPSTAKAAATPAAGSKS